MHVDTVWCPSGPELVRGTTRTFAEQEQGARDEVNDEDERDDHLPEDDEPPPLSATRWEAIEAQGQAMLKSEYGGSAGYIAGKWSGGLDAGFPFAGCNVVHTCSMRDDELLAFAKSLVTVDEVFLDELLTRSDARRRGFADHNLLQLLLLFPHKEWCRLQVRMDNTDVIKKYRKWTMKKYTHPKDEPNSGCMFMRAKCAAVVAALQSTLSTRPLEAGVKLWTTAARPVPGFELDHVIFAPAATEDDDDAPDDEVPREEPVQPEEDADEAAAQPFNNCLEEDRMTRNVDETETALPGKKPAERYGIKNFADALCMLLLRENAPSNSHERMC